MFALEKIVIAVKHRDFVPSEVCAVDQFLNSSFNKNDCGWLRNDISALAAAQTREQYEEILRRMKDMPSTSSIPEGMKLEDAFNLVKPRNCQTENEFVDFVGFMTEKGLKNAEKAYAADVARRFASRPLPIDKSLTTADDK